MKIEFPSLSSLAERHTDLPLPCAIDLKWERQFTKNCKNEADLDWAFHQQIELGNLLRVSWLLEAVCHVPKGTWSIMGAKEEKTPSKTRIACYILENFRPLQDPQRQIVDYIIREGRVKKDIVEDRVAHAAIEYGHNSLLPHLEVNWPSFAVQAVNCANMEALSYILRANKVEEQDRREFMLSLYRSAGTQGNIEALDILKDFYSLPDDDLIKLSRDFAKNRVEVAEWFIKAGANPDKVFQCCMETEAFDFADRLLEHYNADLDADDCAALNACLDTKKQKSLEYLADKGADMSKALPLIRDKPQSQCTAFDWKLRHIFASKSISKQLVDWYTEDSTTLVREHRTANLSHKMIFFFDEREVAQSVTNVKTEAQINHKISSFDSFHNRDLLAEARSKLKELGGDPGPEVALKSLQQVKPPFKPPQG